MLCSRLTVEFSPPWWVGTLERWEDGRYEVGRVVFGAEPTEPGGTSLGAAPAVPAAHHSGDGSACRRPEAQNPKRRQRQIAREQQRPAGKKAWAAVAAGREAEKQTRRQQTAEERREAAREQYRLHRQKRQQKHRGH